MRKATMYHVEKFYPTECPKCRQAFKSEKKDWSRLLGDIIDGKKVFRETEGYLIIICAHCENYTAQYMLETYQLQSKERAQELCDKEGFVNLMEVQATGNHCDDMHCIYNKPSGLKVHSIKIEDKEGVR